MNKILKKTLLASIASFSAIFVASCDFLSNATEGKDITVIVTDKDKDNNEEIDDYRYSIYRAALNAGYTGTYEEWL